MQVNCLVILLSMILFTGLVHLEALEMLSRQCDMKIKTLLSKANGTELIELKETLNQVKGNIILSCIIIS